MKRAFDISLAIIACLILFIPFCLIALAVYFTSPGPVLYWSDRIGRANKLFSMPKFRSMKVDTPSVATHLLPNPDEALTSIGGFLRKTSLDEIPQLWSIIRGDMSFVGPRPALFNQDDLVLLRKEKGIDDLLPGLTGWAQINGRDSITLKEKVKLETEYKQRQTFLLDMKILWKTLGVVVTRSSVSH